MIDISAEEVRILRRMLGAVSHIRRASWGFRNHFASGEQGNDRKVLDALLAKGLVRLGYHYPTSGLTLFHAAAAGMDAAGLTTAQKRRALER